MLRTRVVWNGVAGTPWYSNFYWAGDDATLADSAQDKTILWAQYVSAIVVNELSLQVESEVVAMNPTTGDIIEVFNVAGSTSTGEILDDPLPFQTQALTKFGTAGVVTGPTGRTRRVSGRSFCGGLEEAANVTGVGPTETYREGVQGCYSLAFGGGGAVHVVWARDAGLTFNVTSYQTNTVWSTLRSRRGV